MNKKYGLLACLALSLSMQMEADSCQSESCQTRKKEKVSSVSSKHSNYTTGIVYYVNSKEELNDMIKSGVVIVDFFANWCPPCRRLSPMIDEFVKEFKDILFVKVDKDKLAGLASEYGIQGIPTLLFFKDGQIVDSVRGLRDKDEYRSLFKKLIR
jgi:thioredoxin 1